MSIDEHRFGDCPFWPTHELDRLLWGGSHEWVKVWDEEHPSWPPVVIGMYCVNCNYTFSYGKTVLLP